MLYHETLMLNLMHYYNVQGQQFDKQLLDLMKHEMLKYKFINMFQKAKKKRNFTDKSTPNNTISNKKSVCLT